MTALREYARLESTGLWRAAPDAQRREVSLSFGEATLVIMDGAGRPLSHWSLPAIHRLNPGQMPARYSPDPEPGEELEIEDELMVGAIDRIHRTLDRARPRPGRLRHAGIAAVLGAIALAAVVWLPDALLRQTLAVVPDARRTEIGATLLGHIQARTGPACRAALGIEALAVMQPRLRGEDAPGQIVVVPGRLASALLLPGGITVLSQDMVETAREPAVLAGHVLGAGLAGDEAEDPLAPLLRYGGFLAVLRLLTTGDLPPDILEPYARGLLDAAPRPVPQDRLIAAFEAARVPLTPFARSLDASGESVLPMIEADAIGLQALPPILNDDQWVSLQAICRI